jgi:autoinducer 2-degrading protein
MVATTVLVQVKEEHIDDFIAATIENHDQSVKEPGNVRFDVLQSKNEPSHFMLYEAYESTESAAAHKETLHYKKWRDEVAGWMAQPREGVPYVAIRP